MPEEIDYVELSDVKCYICGRSEDDLKIINEKLFSKYNGDLKDYYYENFGIRLEEKIVTPPKLFHWGPDDYIKWRGVSDSDYVDSLFHPNETTDQWVQLALKFGILRIVFKKESDEIIPVIELTGKTPSDEQMKEFYKVDESGWLRGTNLEEKLISNLKDYCNETKKGYSNHISGSSYGYLKEGIIKQFDVNLKVHICTICSLVQLPGLRCDDDDDYDDEGSKSYDNGFEYSAIDQDNWGGN